jgi:hypothetical protein
LADKRVPFEAAHPEQIWTDLESGLSSVKFIDWPIHCLTQKSLSAAVAARVDRGSTAVLAIIVDLLATRYTLSSRYSADDRDHVYHIAAKIIVSGADGPRRRPDARRGRRPTDGPSSAGHAGTGSRGRDRRGGPGRGQGESRHWTRRVPSPWDGPALVVRTRHTVALAS